MRINRKVLVEDRVRLMSRLRLRVHEVIEVLEEQIGSAIATDYTCSRTETHAKPKAEGYFPILLSQTSSSRLVADSMKRL